MMPKLPTHGYGTACLQVFKDKLVEINTGEIKTTLNFSDWDQAHKNVIRGTFVDVIGDAIVMECDINNTKKKVMVNCWLIISITEIDDKFGIRDVYVDDDTRAK